MIKVTEIKTEVAWSWVLGAAQNPVQYTHTWFWGELQIALGRTVFRYEIVHNEKSLGFFTLVIYPFVFGKKLGYIPYGPVLAKPKPDQPAKLQSCLKKLVKKYDLVLLRNEAFGCKTPLFAYRTAFAQPRGQMLLDISPSEATLRSGLSKSTRRNLKRAEEHGLQTKFYFSLDILKIKAEFIEMNQQNTEAHQTTTHTAEYFETFFNLLARGEQNFAVACYASDGKILAINLYFVQANYAFCPYGANTDTGKQLGAYYFLKWQSILKLQELGVQTFDWGGIAVGKADEHLQGLNQFKFGFGGEQIVHSDYYDMVGNWLLYILYLLRKFLK